MFISLYQEYENEATNTYVSELSVLFRRSPCQRCQISMSSGILYQGSPMKNSSLTPLLDRCAIDKFRGGKKRKEFYSLTRICYYDRSMYFIFGLKMNVNIFFFFFLSFVRRKYIGESVEQNWPRWHREKMYIQRWIDYGRRGESCGESSIGSTWIRLFERRIGPFEGHLSSPWRNDGSKDESWLR